MQIYKFNSILKPVLWGGDKLVTFKHLPASEHPIGESWELSALPGRESVVTEGDDRGLTLSDLVLRYRGDLVGEEVYHRYGDKFPLLIKVIDAKRDLSIQVHPDNEMAGRLYGCSGKNEMWYVLYAEEGATICTGFSRTVSAEEFDRRLADGTILEVINKTKSQRGDVFFIPAGQIHSIGAGNLLVEIQQSSDITYRVWDYNRRDADGNLRQLHVQEAREALDFEARNGKIDYSPVPSPGVTPLVTCPEFDVRRIDFEDSIKLQLPPPHSCVAVFCTKGGTTMRVKGMPDVMLSQGEIALIPAIVDSVEMSGQAQLLTAAIPPQNKD